jgi:hypothetical protein
MRPATANSPGLCLGAPAGGDRRRKGAEEVWVGGDLGRCMGGAAEEVSSR